MQLSVPWGLLAVSLASAVGAHAQVAVAPTFSVDDSWKFFYRDTRYAKAGCEYSLTVTQVRANEVRAVLGKAEGCEAGITGTMPVASGSSQKFDQALNHYYYSNVPYRVFDFPLEVGKKWVQDYTYKIGPWNYTANLEAVVSGQERVTVPAGSFETFRVEIKRSYRGDAPGRPTQSGMIKDTLWYSADVKTFVRRTYSDIGSNSGMFSNPIVRELVEYRVR